MTIFRVNSNSNSIHDVGQNGDRNEKPGNVVEDERRDVGVRVLEGVPHPLADSGAGNGRWAGVVVDVLAARKLCVLGPGLLGVLHLPVAVLLIAAVGDALRQDPEELELGVKGRDALVALSTCLSVCLSIYLYIYLSRASAFIAVLSSRSTAVSSTE